jgi:hypothetical protein
MAENKQDLEQPPVGFETTDVNAWAIGKFGIALALICIASMGMLLMLFHYFIAREGPVPPKAYSDLAHAGVRRPAAPQLEETPALDLQRERAAEDQILNSYGWVDKQQGIVRIPIDQAIDLLARKGLPSRTEAPAVSNVSVPSESGLGPIMQQTGGPLAGGSK